jgi:hypothetical protein
MQLPCSWWCGGGDTTGDGEMGPQVPLKTVTRSFMSTVIAIEQREDYLPNQTGIRLKNLLVYISSALFCFLPLSPGAIEADSHMRVICTDMRIRSRRRTCQAGSS